MDKDCAAQELYSRSRKICFQHFFCLVLPTALAQLATLRTCRWRNQHPFSGKGNNFLSPPEIPNPPIFYQKFTLCVHDGTEVEFSSVGQTLKIYGAEHQFANTLS
jgi:hypothetical protein